MTVLSAIEAEFKKLELAFGEVGTFLKPAFEKLVQGGGPVLIAAAQKAAAYVEAQMPYLATTLEKKAAAYVEVVADLVAQGVPIVENAVNLAIETAVSAIPNVVAAAVAPAAPAPPAPPAPPAK